MLSCWLNWKPAEIASARDIERASIGEATLGRDLVHDHSASNVGGVNVHTSTGRITEINNELEFLLLGQSQTGAKNEYESQYENFS